MLFSKLGDVVTRHPWRVVAVWIVAFFVLGSVAPKLKTSGDQTSFLPTKYESVRALHTAQRAFPGHSGSTGIFVVQRSDHRVLTAADRARIARTAATEQRRRAPIVTAVALPKPALSRDGRTALIAVAFAKSSSDKRVADAVKDLRRQTTGTLRPAGLTAQMTGPAAQVVDVAQADKDAEGTVMLATGVLILILLTVIFRSIVTRRSVERPARPRLEGMRALAPRADHGRRVVGLEARHDDERDVEHLRDLARDGLEDRVRFGAPGDERGHATQRGLLTAERDVAARLDVGERDDRATPVPHVERHRDIGHGELRAVAAEEPVEVAADGLARRSRQQHGALGRRVRRAVRMRVVDGLVARAAEQLVRVVVAERGDRRWVGVADEAVGIHDPDRLGRRLQHGRQEVLRTNLPATEFRQRVQHGGPILRPPERPIPCARRVLQPGAVRSARGQDPR
jgi:hypothetical protein